MSAMSRTEYSVKNTTVAVIARVIAIFMGYATRVVFIHALSEDYVGVNGLFTDILNVLALSELGVGTAITYALYKPIAQGDIEKQKSLMRMYRTFYRVVAFAVTAIGLAVIPFMDVLIKNQPKVDHLILIYLLYLLNSVISYLLIYKKTLIDAHQMFYIGTLYQNLFYVLQDVLQIIILIWTHNFILFLLIYIACTFGSNLCISMKADRLYPYLRDRKVMPLPDEERSGIFRNIKAMLMHKVGQVVVNNTDNLLLSAFVGIGSVGIYSNYFLIIGSIRQVLDQVFQGLAASVGNLGVTEDRQKVKKVFETTFFVGNWFYGFAAICLFELINPFVELSFGSNYVFAGTIVLVLCMNFYVNGMRQASLMFHDSLGLFWFDRYKSIVEAVINLVVSIILVRWLGIIGVFVGTFISTMLTSFWVEPYVLYKHHLRAGCASYFMRYGIYSVVTAAIWLLTNYLCQYTSGGVFLVMTERLIICAIVPNLCMILLYWRTEEMRFMRDKLQFVIGNRRGGTR